MSDSHLPPLSSDGVFSVSASSTINAPPEKVWAILLDFASYNEWNAFVRGQVVTDSSKQPLQSQTPAEGQYLYIYPVHLPPTMEKPGLFGESSAFVQITTLDHENFRVAWNTAGLPHFLLHTERWQALSYVSIMKQTRYETIEVFGGLLAYFVNWFVRPKLVLGFQAMAEGLKRRAEQA